MSQPTASQVRRTRELILACCQPTTPDRVIEAGIAGVVPERFLALADFHRIGSLLHARLRGIDALPDTIAQGLAGMSERAHAVRLHALWVLRSLHRALPAPYLVVKGPMLSRWYRNEEEREFSDLDVLVAPNDFAAAFHALRGAGFESRATNWHGFLAHEVAEVPLGLGPSTVDLHWNLVGLGATRRDLRLATTDLFDNCVEVDVGGIPVPTTDPADTLLHLCVNTGLDGGRLLRGLIDIHAVAASGRVDPDEFARRAARSGARQLSAAVLQRCRALLGNELPEAYVTALAPSRTWLMLNRIVDAVESRTRVERSGVASGAIIVAGRDSAQASARALANSISSYIDSRRGRPALSHEGGELDWRARPVDGDIERHRLAYMDFVQRQARTVRRTRCRDVDELHARIGAFQPRSTPMLGAAFLEGLGGRRARADLFLLGDGTLGGALVRYRWRVGGVTAYPLVLDPDAAEAIGTYVERSATTDLSAAQPDADAIRPFVPRWRTSTAATPASLPPGFEWGPPPDNVRVGTRADLDDLVEAFWQHSPHAYPNKWLLRRRLQRAIDNLVLVLEVGTPPTAAGFAMLDSSTPEYDFWAHVVILPEHRGLGLSWDMVAAGAAHAARRRVGGMVCVVESNPMPIPDDAFMGDGWTYVALSPPRRFRGEVRVRRALDGLLGAGRRRASAEPEVSYRSAGATDTLVSDRRSQRWWSDRTP